MKTEMTTDNTGRMIPKEAKASRVQTTWYTRLEKPDMKKSANRIRRITLMRARHRGLTFVTVTETCRACGIGNFFTSTATACGL